MSEAERKKRLSYKENRKRWIFIQGVALIIVAVLIFASLITYTQLNRESYINYTESSGVDYKVKIKPGTPFYEEYKDYYANESGEVWLDSGEAYPAGAVDIIIADVNYELNMEAGDVDYEYSYSVFATAEVVDSVTKNKFNMPVIDIKTKSTHRQNSNNKLFIHEEIPVDYNAYNEMVNNFTKQLGITKATSTLIVTMEVSVVGSSNDFASDSQNTHVVNISVPLTEQSFKVDYSSSIPTGESKVLAYKNAGNQHLYRGAAITLGAVELLLFVVFISFVYLTRNHDVNYSIKVKRLVNSYGSFIQRVTNGFDAVGYQILEIASFREMLSIRDTIQSPVLMSENTDKTRTQFFIPTNIKILYLFEVKVENYDELYGYNPEWIDDSLISTKKTSVEDKAAEEIIPLIKEEPVANQTDELVIKLLAEIEKLKMEMQAPANASVSAPMPQCTPGASCFGAADAKIGNFSAQGDVIINYNEQPSESVVTEVIKKLTETIMQANKEDAEKKDSHTVDNAPIVQEQTEEQEDGCNASQQEACEENAEANEEAVEDAAVSEITEATQPVVEDEVEAVLEAVQEAQSTEELSENKHLDLEHILNDFEYDEEHCENHQIDTSFDTLEQDNAEVPTLVQEIESMLETVDTGDVQSDNTDVVSELLISELEVDESGEIVIPEGKKLEIHCKRSFSANLMQSDSETVKHYYNEIKNYILSFKGVKERMSWKYESYKKGRQQLFRLRIKGKSLCLYCALNPDEISESRYHHSLAAARSYADVPTMVRIKSARGLKRAKELIDAVMSRFSIYPNPKANSVDYFEIYPFRKTIELVEMGYIKILSDSYKIKEPKAPKKSATQKATEKKTTAKK